jgi:hypothetical protein
MWTNNSILQQKNCIISCSAYNRQFNKGFDVLGFPKLIADIFSKFHNIWCQLSKINSVMYSNEIMI